MDGRSLDPNESSERIVGVFGLRYAAHTAGYNQPFDREDLVHDVLNSVAAAAYADGSRLSFISGGSRGVEIVTEHWARSCGHEFFRIHPRRPDAALDAFGIRNQQIISECTDFIIFWDGADITVSRVIREISLAGKQQMVIPVK